MKEVWVTMDMCSALAKSGKWMAWMVAIPNKKREQAVMGGDKK